MRGLRLALSRPLVGVTTLAAMAQAAFAETGSPVACVLHDAKRDEVYAFAATRNETRVPEQLSSFDDVVAAIAALDKGAEPIALAGTASARGAEALLRLGKAIRPTKIMAPDAVWVARIALAAPAPDRIPPPLYLRPPDARLPNRTA